MQIRYRSWTYADGKLFQDAWQPQAGKLSTLIQGWQQGLVGQTVGSRVLLVVPRHWPTPTVSRRRPRRWPRTRRWSTSSRSWTRSPGPERTRHPRRSADRRAWRPALLPSNGTDRARVSRTGGRTPRPPGARVHEA
ncbi:hypothetical protein G7085_18280 [Tessaracoccus sp. HDW20]|uniref:FKBP-type peptidyl-prolyl cis-trans isomerase n=1 Tax=Tessaracoccus coleopterorum TaxID=2714950 RepID=UPI0038CD7AA6|nr:hypothetical protein [Tessaracoccus coleopterorum]